MRAVCYLLLVVLLSCQSNNETIVGPERTALAFIDNSTIYADGCEVNIQLDSGTLPNTGSQYKPTAATLPLVERAISALAAKDSVRIPIKIRFMETANRSVIHCGWVSPTVTEIKVLEISKR
ncbi:hypothetical protein GCM10028805_40480 [Spirosoma harenae]